jgi:hypothetical protein
MKVFSERGLRERCGPRAIEAFYRRAAERRAKREALTEADILEAMRAERKTDQPHQNGDGYNCVIGMLTGVARKAGKIGIGLEEYLPALIDYTAAVALIIGDEEGLQAFMTRMQSRIDEWRAGTFPSLASLKTQFGPLAGDWSVSRKVDRKPV